MRNPFKRKEKKEYGSGYNSPPFLTYPSPVQPLKPVPSEADIKLTKEINYKTQEIYTRIQMWPQEQDFVRIKLLDKVGQVINVFVNIPKDNLPYYCRSLYGITYSDLEMAQMKYINASLYYGVVAKYTSFEVRLPKGSIVGSLKHWEIEKVPKP